MNTKLKEYFHNSSQTKNINSIQRSIGYHLSRVKIKKKNLILKKTNSHKVKFKKVGRYYPTSRSGRDRCMSIGWAS
jgi:hypothetical protein